MATSGDATRQWSLHSQAGNFLKSRLGGGEGGQTNSSSSLPPKLCFGGFHLQGENSQCNSKLPRGLHHYRVGGTVLFILESKSRDTHTKQTPSDLAGLSLHTLLPGRSQGCLAAGALTPAQLQRQAPVLDTAHEQN